MGTTAALHANKSIAATKSTLGLPPPTPTHSVHSGLHEEQVIHWKEEVEAILRCQIWRRQAGEEFSSATGGQKGQSIPCSQLCAAAHQGRPTELTFATNAGIAILGAGHVDRAKKRF